MKKFLILILILFFAIPCALAKKSKNSVVRVEIETKDKTVLIGDLYFSRVKGEKKPLVILLHSIGGKSSDWGDLPKRIVEGGNNVFALDLRGHGRSVLTSDLRYRSKNYFDLKTWAKLPNDVLDSIKFLESNYSKIDYNKIIIVGADIGANTAVLAGNKMKVKPLKFVLITPTQEFKGLSIPLIIANFDTTEMMLLVSKSDKYFYKEALTLSKFIQTNCTMKVFERGSSGIILIKQNPAAQDDIIKFIYGIEVN